MASRERPSCRLGIRDSGDGGRRVLAEPRGEREKPLSGGVSFSLLSSVLRTLGQILESYELDRDVDLM